MARPHIEFIQAQVVPWRDLDGASFRPGAALKVLSEDDETGALTSIVRYPRGWRFDETHHVTADEEFFVLDGALQIDDATYTRHGYGYFPAGLTRATMAAPEGAAVVTFFQGTPRCVAGAGKTNGEGMIVNPDGSAAAWSDDFDHRLTGSGIAIKFLRRDAATGERTWLLSKGEDRREDLPATGRLETHPCVEEFFLIEGTLGWPQGMMRPGAYFWRPPGIEHGPGASLTGYIGLFRSLGAPFSTDWSDVERPRPFEPIPYAPILPPHLAALAGASYRGAEAY